MSIKYARVLRGSFAYIIIPEWRRVRWLLHFLCNKNSNFNLIYYLNILVEYCIHAYWFIWKKRNLYTIKMLNNYYLSWSNPSDEDWRHVRKLGSFLGDSEDVQKRESLATAAFWRLWKLWTHPHLLSEPLRVRLYNIYVLPILYSCGSWVPLMEILAALEHMIVVTSAASSAFSIPSV